MENKHTPLVLPDENLTQSNAIALVNLYSDTIEDLVKYIAEDIYRSVPLEKNFKRLNRIAYNRTEFNHTWTTLVWAMLIEKIYLLLMEESIKASFKYGKEFMKGELDE